MHDLRKPILPGKGASDYERYLRTDELLALQKPPEESLHPDELTFGSPVRVSQIIARVAAVAGVTSAEVTRLRRLSAPDSGALATGVLSFGPLEIPRCDNDPVHPEHGRLVIVPRGGR